MKRGADPNAGGDRIGITGQSSEPAASLRVRSALMVELLNIVKQRDISHTEAAALFGVSQRCAADLMSGKIDRLSLDRLIEMATAAGLDPIVTIAINKPKATRKPGDPPLQLRGISALDIDLAGIEGGHDPTAADYLIRTFFAELEQGNLFAHGIGQQEKTFLRYIQHAFGRYVDGQPLDTAFGFKLGRGEKDVKLSIDDRNLSIAASVEILVRKEMKDRSISKPRLVMEKPKRGKGRMISTVKMEPIYDEVAKNCEVKSKSIEKIFGEFETATESLPDAHLALLAEHLTKSV